MIRAVIDHTIASGQVSMDGATHATMLELRDFMFQRVYLRPEAEEQKQRAILVIRNLIDYFVHHPEEVPEGTTMEGSDPLTAAIDFVAGMTDRYAIQTHDRLFRPTLF
jgi:dGTPase